MSTITISLPSEITRQINTETKKKGFATRSEFIRAILRRYFIGELPLEQFTPRPIDDIREALTRTGKYNKQFISSVIKGLSKSSAYEG